MRDRASVSYKEVAEKRESSLDNKAKERVFEVGTNVLYRTLERDTNLSESLEGPYVVCKILGPLTYQLDVGGKKRKVAHIRFLKEYVEK